MSQGLVGRKKAQGLVIGGRILCTCSKEYLQGRKDVTNINFTGSDHDSMHAP